MREIKCVVCDRGAEYIYFGQSLCEVHFQQKAKRAEEVDKKMEEAKSETRGL